MVASLSLAELRESAFERVPDPPALDQVVEDAGRQRMAAYYLYSAIIAGVIDNDDLAPAQWPAKLAEPMQRMGLTRLAPRTTRGLDAQLMSAEQATRQSPDRQSDFARLLVDQINRGVFGPLCGAADSVRLATAGPQSGQDLELIKDNTVVGTCKVQDHWELVAQQLAGAPLLDQAAQAEGSGGLQSRLESQLKETGISHAVSWGTTLAVNIHPLGAAAGYGTRLVRSRIRTGRDEAGTLHGFGSDLRTLRTADGELADRLPETAA